MKKSAILATLMLFPPPMIAAEDPCNPDTGGTFLGCITHINQRIFQLEKENQARNAENQAQQKLIQAQQDEIQALKLRLSVSEGLVAHYPFEGNANDVSENGHHGTVHGATLTEDRFGNPNSAYRFDGQDDYITITDNPTIRLNDSFTIAAWVKSHLASSYFNGIIQGNSSESWYSWVLRVDSSLKPQLSIAHPEGGWTGATDKNVLLNAWVHLVGVWNHLTNTAKLYKNGVEVGHFTKQLTRRVHNQSIVIGYYPYEGRYWKGIIDDVYIYNHAFTAWEIQALYKQPQFLLTKDK